MSPALATAEETRHAAIAIRNDRMAGLRLLGRAGHRAPGPATARPTGVVHPGQRSAAALGIQPRRRDWLYWCVDRTCSRRFRLGLETRAERAWRMSSSVASCVGRADLCDGEEFAVVTADHA